MRGTCELVINGRAYPLPSDGPTRLGQPPNADIPIANGSATVIRAGTGVEVQNTGDLPIFFGEKTVYAKGKAALAPGQTIQVGNSSVLLRKSLPAAGWRRLLVPLLLLAAGVVALLAYPSGEPPVMDFDKVIRARYPAAATSFAAARAAEARGDKEEAAREYGAVRDAVLLRIAGGGPSQEDRDVLAHLAKKLARRP